MIKYFLISILASVVIACYEDKGNYDYREINEVRISGIDKQYKVGRWDTLAISTQVENSLVENSSLVYAWYLDHVKVATTKDLNYIVTEKPKTYNARFEVVDTTLDNVRFFQDFEVTVFSQYSEGIILLSEEEGNPYISFLNTIDNPTNEVTYDVFALENGKNLQGEALAIEQSDPYSYGGVLFVHTSETGPKGLPFSPVLPAKISPRAGLRRRAGTRPLPSPFGLQNSSKAAFFLIRRRIFLNFSFQSKYFSIKFLTILRQIATICVTAFCDYTVKQETIGRVFIL